VHVIEGRASLVLLIRTIVSYSVPVPCTRRPFVLFTRSNLNMKLSLSAAALVVLSWTPIARAACSADLLIDNYANYPSSTNSLGQYTSGMFFTHPITLHI